jgi:hypothetical protein
MASFDDVRPAGVFGTPVGGFIVVASFVLAFGMISFAIFLSEPSIDPVTMEDCRCCMEGQNLSFSNPVEAFYWLETNHQTEPVFIVMKYHLANECGWNCTIWDEEEELKMIKRVQKIHNFGENAP